MKMQVAENNKHLFYMHENMQFFRFFMFYLCMHDAIHHS